MIFCLKGSLPNVSILLLIILFLSLVSSDLVSALSLYKISSLGAIALQTYYNLE